MSHLLRLVCLTDQYGLLFISDIPTPQLVPAHPNNSGPLIREVHLLNLEWDFRVFLDDFVTVMPINDGVVPHNKRLSDLPISDDIFFQFGKLVC